MDNDPTHMMPPRLNHHHHPSLMSRSPGDGLYNNLYDKDIGLMRKLMSFEEFQCSGNNNGTSASNNNEINSTTKQQQFQQFSSNGAANGGLFNGKFSSTTNFPFLFDKQLQQQQQSTPNNMRHEGLLKPCYEFPTKADGLDDGFGSNPITTGGLRKQQQQQQQQTLTSTTTTTLGFTSSGFINQFSHESLFSANNHHSNFTTKLNEINNNNNNNSNGVGGGNGIISGGIVIKTENGVNDYHHSSSSNSGGSNAMQMNNNNNNNKTNENLCPRSSNAMNKTEPNEFKSNSCKGSLDNSQTHHDDDDGGERKPSLVAVTASALNDESTDGFTQL
jgi:hypothetical protein